MPSYQIFRERPNSTTLDIEDTDPDYKNYYAPYLKYPVIKALLTEVMYRDYNLESCRIFCTGTERGKKQYEVSYPSSLRADTATVP